MPAYSPYLKEWLEAVTAPRPVLLVEDNQDDCQLILRTSKDFNIDWTVVNDFSDAVKSFERCEYKLIFLDLNLGTEPGGISLFRRLKAKCPEIPVVILSGFINNEVLSEINSIGFAMFLQKPPNYDIPFFEQLFLALGIPRRPKQEAETNIEGNI